MKIINTEHLLDGNSSINIREEFESMEKHKQKDREDGKRIGDELRPIIEKIYKDRGKQPPFRTLDIDIDLTE